MRKPPKGSTPPVPPPLQPPLDESGDEATAETTAPGSRNAGLGSAQALSTWPVVCAEDLTPPPGWDPTERQLIESEFGGELPLKAPPEPPRGRWEGVVRFLTRLRELPGRRSSRGGDQNGQ